MLQSRLQSIKLIKHVHQNLTMSRLNSHDSLQHTSNVWIIRSRRWRNISSSIINGLLSCSITCRRRRRRKGGVTPESSTLGRLELAFIWAALYLRKVAPMGAMIWTNSDSGNSTKQRQNIKPYTSNGLGLSWKFCRKNNLHDFQSIESNSRLIELGRFTQ